MSKYVCPICGKSYDDVNELSNCVAKCAKEKTAASEQLNKLRMEACEKHKKDLNMQKDKINEVYNTLLAEIEKYNNIANKISKIDTTFSSKCEASLNFGPSNKVDVNKTSKPKRMDRVYPLPPLFPCMPLSALIDEIFDF